MTCFSYISLAVFCIVAVAVCRAIPRPDTLKETRNGDTENEGGALKIAHWLRSAVAAAKGRVPSNNIQGDAEIKQQDNIFKAEEDYLLALHNEDTESDNAIIPTSVPDVDIVNPFVRSKRSTCAIPANLPQMVRDLNTHLSPSQFIGLNPEEPIPPTMLAGQHDTCPDNTTNNWWPGQGDNFRSTCPWKIEQFDLGVNAYPRYVNNATCLCVQCIESTSNQCTEVTYNMTYFELQGCQNGLAIMEQKSYIVNVGCYCTGPEPNDPNLPVPNFMTEQ